MCDKCQKYTEKEYKICPKCGKDLIVDIDKIKKEIMKLYRGRLDDKDLIYNLQDISDKIPDNVTIYVLTLPDDTRTINGSDTDRPDHGWSKWNGHKYFGSYICRDRAIGIVDNLDIENIYYPVLKYFDGWDKIVKNFILDLMCLSVSKLDNIYGSKFNGKIIPLMLNEIRKPYIPIFFEKHNKIGNGICAGYKCSYLPNLEICDFSMLGEIKRENIIDFVKNLYKLNIIDDTTNELIDV